MLLRLAGRKLPRDHSRSQRPQNQVEQLRRWKVHFKQIGFEVGRPFSVPLLSPELLQWKLRDDFIETHARNRLKAELQTMPTLKGSFFSVRPHPLLRK